MDDERDPLDVVRDVARLFGADGAVEIAHEPAVPAAGSAGAVRITLETVTVREESAEDAARQFVLLLAALVLGAQADDEDDEDEG